MLGTVSNSSPTGPLLTACCLYTGGNHKALQQSPVGYHQCILLICLEIKAPVDLRAAESILSSVGSQQLHYCTHPDSHV